MKNKIALIIALAFTTSISFAQKSISGVATTATNAVNASSSAGTGNLFSQLKSGINADAFSETFNASAWSKKNTSASSAAGWAGSLLGLQGGLKESAMSAGWATVKEKWLKNVKAATTVQQVAGLAAQLESNIDPKYFTGEWGKQRGTWQAAIKTIAAK